MADLILTYSSAMIPVVDWIPFRCLSKRVVLAFVGDDEGQILCGAWS
jgi:hypothetical protein